MPIAPLPTVTLEFSLDPKGIVLAVEGDSRITWRMTEEEIIGRSFLDLFVIDVQSETEDQREIFWQAICDAAISAQLPIDAQPADGDPFSVEITLQVVGDRGYTATVTVPKSNRMSETKSGDREVHAPFPPPTPVEKLPVDEGTVPPSLLAQTGKTVRDTAPDPWTALIEQPHIGFFDLDIEKNRFYYSPAWKAMLGYADYELPDKHETLIKLFHPEDSEAAPDQPHQPGNGKTAPYSVEYRLRHKSGHYVWIQAVGVQTFNTAGELTRVTGIHLDIQERKEMEDQAQRNEERFLALLDRGNLAFFDLDFRAGEAFFSPAWLKNLGYDETDIPALPKSFKRLLDPSTSSEEYFTLFTDEKEGREVFTREFRFQRKGGSFVNLPLRIIRLSSRRGELQRVIGIEAQTEEALPSASHAPSGEMLLEGLQAVHEAVILTNAHSQVIFVNQKAEALIGKENAECGGEDLLAILPLVHASGGQPAPNFSDEVLSSGCAIVFSRDYCLEDAGGETREILLSCNPVRDANGRILGTVVVFRDPGEMSLTPEELVRSNRLESLGLLAGGIAHDFNNLLTAILGGISLARETKELDPLDGSEKGCLAAKNLTRQLLGFARGRSLGKKAMRLNSLISDSLRMAVAGSKIPVEAKLPDDLHPVLIDTSQLHQVFQNIFINAVQAMDDCERPSLRVSGENIALEANAVAGLPAGDYLRVVVQDSGPGIPPRMLEQIFHPFFTTKKTGTGLGLSTVHSIVRNHGGQITVASRVGEGSTFTVYLPRTDEAQEKESRRAPSLKYGSGRILFMDDDEEIATLAAGMLARLDYTYDIARNGEEAIALYKRYLNVDRPYDAVILDLTIIGGMGGEETVRKLRELDPDVRAIVSSGYNTDETNEYYLNHGFHGVLSKPYRSEEMGKVLRQVLGKEPMNPEVPESPGATKRDTQFDS